MNETIKQEAYNNLPTKYRRQHSQFDFGGTGRGEIPVARERYHIRADYMADVGFIEETHLTAVVKFMAWKLIENRERDVKLSSCYDDVKTDGLPPEIDIDDKTACDRYRAMLRKMHKDDVDRAVFAGGEYHQNEVPALTLIAEKVYRSLERMTNIMQQVEKELA